MELNVGYYIRTDKGYIAKIKQIQDDNYIFCDNVIKKEFCDSYEQCYSDTINIVKASENIIDLIEVGDYVNEELVTFISSNPQKNQRGKHRIILNDSHSLFGKYNDIKSIVTKEMFNSVKYEVE